MSENFQRARSADQKSQREAQILDAAQVTVMRMGLDDVTMADIAKEAGLTQSGFYRYFKSKEEILAHLLIREAEAISGLLSNTTTSQSLAAFAHHYTAICAERPLFCALASNLAHTLERNISTDRLVLIKQEFGRLLNIWADILLSSGAVKERDKALRFIHAAHVILAGLWPMAQPRPHVKDAAQQAGLPELASTFQQDFTNLLNTFAIGLTHNA